MIFDSFFHRNGQDPPRWPGQLSAAIKSTGDAAMVRGSPPLLPRVPQGLISYRGGITAAQSPLRIVQTVVEQLQFPEAGLVDVVARTPASVIAPARLRPGLSPTRRASSPLFDLSDLWIMHSRSQASTDTSATVLMSAIIPAVTTSSSTAPESLTDPASPSDSHSSAAAPPVSPSSTSFPQRIKSKASFRSLRSQPDDQEKHVDDKSLPPPPRPSFLRRLSPGLAARVKLLDGSTKTAQELNRSKNQVGKLSQEHLRELEKAHQDLSIRIQRRGRAWSGGHELSDVKRGTSQHSQPEPRGRTWQQDQDAQLSPIPSPADAVIEITTDTTEQATPDATPAVAAEPASDGPFAENIRTNWEDNDTPAEADMSVAEPAQAPQTPSAEPGETEVSFGETDLEKYLKSSTQNDERPPPPPKDSPRTPSTPSSSSTAQSYFNSHGLHRTESIYSFSRASFSSQLSQLTSINLPEPSSLEGRIFSIPDASAAVRALNGAAQQISTWINKASDVLSGLDAEDDVEWAAAGGREGLDDVDRAITKFEGLVDVYVTAIEQVQLRDDIKTVTGDVLKTIVAQMEHILGKWSRIRSHLKGVKEQVELAMEWEELWGVVLGDVGLEVEDLGRVIFELEEKRHLSMFEDDEEAEDNNGVDISELETIIEETPPTTSTPNKRFSLAQNYSTPSSQPPARTTGPDDSALLGLFARLQPLRASLDFLPMRLSMFQSRAEKIFPSACRDLEVRREKLENAYKKLENDAEVLRKELDEDRWVLVFRNAGRQARTMCESVERSIGKLQEALDTGAQFNNHATLAKRIESFEAKKIHYGPAIERVISIIEKGVNDRITVNGEILRLLHEMRSRVDALNASIKVMDGLLDDIDFSKTQQLRDSISSIITMDSPATGSVVDTPGSSPASSVVLSNGNGRKGSSTPNIGNSSRRGSSVASTNRKRYSGIPQAASTLSAGRRSSIPRASFSGSLTSPTRSQTSTSFTPRPASRTSTAPSKTPDNRPRWNSSTNTNDLKVGHSYRSPSRTQNRNSRSNIPTPSPLSREASRSPAPPGMRSSSRAMSRLASPTPNRVNSPTFSRSILDPPPYSKLRKQSAPGLPTGPRNRQSYAGISITRSSPVEDRAKTQRPETSLGHSRRLSGIPLPKFRSGRESAASARNKLTERPPWR
ncbi:hypothetical protein DTO166G4_2900 [Paecilomyces variotii]|nr:hypothetical protein DTO166G4_2900 [Paecilomyces variotii]KAJ9233210.1 hypothetical protein DTO166G5_5798 [Paecilomyces variotii]KAJ9370480.1 hypothetical protein DTO282E5_4842 [Paecilomyces variotii]KAJ9398629.1 hypothetical protein DTO282F9_4445 [Paecilomyces variotii]